MILAVDAQIRQLVRDASDEVIGCLNSTHHKDWVAYQLFGAAASLLNSATIYLHNSPTMDQREAAWRLVEAAALVTKGTTPCPEKLQKLLALKSMFRLD